MQTDTQKIRSL